MEFRLTYSGELKSSSSSKARDVQAIRRAIHPQLKLLWEQEPLVSVGHYVNSEGRRDKGEIWLVKQRGGFQFAPLVSGDWFTVAEIDILFLRPSAPGALVGHGGDLDNRIKTLMDGLRMPSASEIPKGDRPNESERPFFCLLEDDALVTSLSIRTDRLLKPKGTKEVELVIHVNMKPTKTVWGNIGI